MQSNVHRIRAGEPEQGIGNDFRHSNIQFRVNLKKKTVEILLFEFILILFLYNQSQ